MTKRKKKLISYSVDVVLYVSIGVLGFAQAWEKPYDLKFWLSVGLIAATNYKAKRSRGTDSLEEEPEPTFYIPTGRPTTKKEDTPEIGGKEEV